MSVPSKVFAFICVHLQTLAAGQKAWGVSLRGGINDDGSVPAVSFGPPSGATSVSTNVGSTALEVKRRGEAVAAFSSEVVRLPQTVSAGEFAAGMELGVRGVPQWTLWDLDTFDTPDSAMWTPNDRGFCSSPEDHFLGGHCRFGANSASRTYSLPPHNRVRVRARVHFIDKWEGETLSLLVHNEPVWSESYDWCPSFLKWMCEKYGVDTCGRNTPDRLSVRAEAVFAHSSPNLELAFNSSLVAGTDPCYSSWGVDDVSIELL